MADSAYKLVQKQAEDETLWLLEPRVGEAYLQQELRRLHVAVEADHATPPACVVTEGEVHDAARSMDWQQVVLNGGPPCFHIGNKRFCGRAERWGGHPDIHTFISLTALITRAGGGVVPQELVERARKASAEMRHSAKAIRGEFDGLNELADGNEGIANTIDAILTAIAGEGKSHRWPGGRHDGNDDANIGGDAGEEDPPCGPG